MDRLLAAEISADNHNIQEWKYYGIQEAVDTYISFLVGVAAAKAVM